MSKTYNPKNKKRSRVHGFLARKGAPGGKRVIKARRRKQRARLSV
ncbi:MAG: 50S ribosomal protein L34 [Candidatus Vogelbacteria bacterium]|nr:50S ribosomal protein L34 [Candidatus Vogelbacteria bacterium]